MHRIDTPGATPDNRFTEGDPTIPTAATEVSAEWLTAVQEEVATVIAGAGIALDKADNGQLLEAIKTLGPDRFKGFATSGQHEAWEADLAAINRNSLYAVRKGTATGLPEDMPAEAWAFVHTMVMPGDAARTQLLWSVDDPDHPGWWRRRTAGAWGEWKSVGSGGSGMPIGMTFWWPGTTPPAGSLAINDGPLLLRAAYPQLWAMAQASGNIITEAAWQAQAAVQSSVGAFSSGDGATTFRCPRLRDFVRGADPAGGRGVGMWQDASSITGSVLYEGGSPGAGLRLNLGSLDGQQQVQSSTANSSSPTTQLSVTTGRMRPPSVSWLPCIKAFDTVTNAGEVDIAALAATLTDKVDKSAWVTLVAGRAWKLPNGLIFQFGTYTGLAYDQSVTITLPATMPTGGLFCAGSDDDTGSNLAVVLAKFMSNGSIRLTNDAAYAVTGGRTISGKWIAVGY
ncbi:hypothetical protein [Nitratidesulfovibrio sp.]|uniref:gp53-like domain-containing protein n=1 Tax=Nitratidesulfovibrio sp. TaxID=2802297 RepID=UPI00333F95A8